MAYFRIITAALSGSKFSLFGDGSVERDFTYIDDIISGIIKVLDGQNEVRYNIYNIGNGEPIVFKDIIDYVVKQTNSKSNIIAVDQPEFHRIVQVKDMYLDTTKINSLGFKKDIDIYQGISKLL
jgi:nucleoside-diphosphate-sugar epimerase